MRYCWELLVNVVILHFELIINSRRDCSKIFVLLFHVFYYDHDRYSRTSLECQQISGESDAYWFCLYFQRFHYATDDDANRDTIDSPRASRETRTFLFSALASIRARYRGVEKLGREEVSRECREDKSVEGRKEQAASVENSKKRDRRQWPFFSISAFSHPFPGRVRC